MKDLIEIKRKIEQGQRKKLLEEKEKQQKKISSTINSALQKKQSFEYEKIKTEKHTARTRLILISAKFAALIAFVFFSGAIAMKAVSSPVHPLAQVKKINSAEKLKQISVECENIYKIFIESKEEELQELYPHLETEYIAEMKSVFSDWLGANFQKIKLFSPLSDENTIYVAISYNQNLNIQFVFRELNNNKRFEGICMNKK